MAIADAGQDKPRIRQGTKPLGNNFFTFAGSNLQVYERTFRKMDHTSRCDC